MTKKETAIYICSILKSINAYKIKTFDNRLRNQKLQYLLQTYNITPKLRYNLYIKGPYSPELTELTYKVKNNYDNEVKSVSFVTNELKNNFKRFEYFIKYDNRKLELITTYLLFKEELNLSDTNAKKELIKLKSCTKKELNFAIKNYNKIKSDIYDKII